MGCQTRLLGEEEEEADAFPEGLKSVWVVSAVSQHLQQRMGAVGFNQKHGHSRGGGGHLLRGPSRTGMSPEPEGGAP